MDKFELDHQILRKLLSFLPLDQLDNIQCQFREDECCYTRLLEILDDLNKNVQNTREKEQSDIRLVWRDYMKTHNNRFLVLMDKYINSYLDKEREANRSGKRIDLENLVSNHSKWNRMMMQRGQGIQYRDDLRRICFVFQLTYPEANELMWSAGQVFDMDNLRDFVIVDCLIKGIYDFGEINDRLYKANVEILFPKD